MAKVILGKNKLNVIIYLLILMGMMTACSSNQFNNSFGFFSAKTMNLVQSAVFEVIIEKPLNDPIIYEREINWENVPYAIRTDKYNSIGTAFAISRTELISAFHVFELNTSVDYFIRDTNGNIFEIDQIKGGCNEKDILIFSVKEKIFDNFFQFENNSRIGSPVFSVGNALGEGIIIRNGFILGTVPEEDSGRWNLLKSSADGSPGNSGGPLITKNGKVVALVTSRKDNILYSIPADVISNYNRSSLNYRIKTNYSHLILPDKINKVFEIQVALPANFTETISIILDAHRIHYKNSMIELFNNAPEYLTGPNNLHLLNSSFSSIFPQFSYVDPNDGNWKLSRMTGQNYDLEEDGRLMHSSRSGFNFYKIRKPRSVPLERINKDPMFIMDLILNNIRTERTLWGWSWDDDSDKYRILSYGTPSSVGQFNDILGRNWITANWNIAYNGNILIMYILPLPNGPVIISTIVSSIFRYEYEIDIQKLCNHTFTAYEATFAEWVEFIRFNDFIPSFLNDLSFEWKSNEQTFVFSCGSISISSDSQSFNWTDNSKLFLFPFWYRNNNNLEFGIRRLDLDKDLLGNDFFAIIRNVKPDVRLGSIAMERWDNLIAENHPFNGRPVISISDNTGSLGTVIHAPQSDRETIFSLYLTMKDPISEENVVQRFNAFRQGLLIRE